MVTCSRFHTEGLQMLGAAIQMLGAAIQMLGAAIQNLTAWANWRPRTSAVFSFHSSNASYWFIRLSPTLHNRSKWQRR